MAVTDVKETVPKQANPLKSFDFPVEGMTCTACAARLEKALKRKTGVKEASVNFALERGQVSYDPAEVKPTDIAEAVTKTGFSVPPSYFSFGVDGMTCTACSTRLEKVLSRLPGVTHAEVNFAVERAEVKGLPGLVTLEVLADAVQTAGFMARIAEDQKAKSQDDEAQADKDRASLRRELWILIASIVLTAPLIAQMISMWLGVGFHLSPWVELALAAPVQIIIGSRFYMAAFKALRAKSSNMDVLVVLGTSAAFLYSLYLLWTLGDAATGKLYFEASAVIITLILLGKFLEARAKRGTTAAIRSLMNLRPESARVLRGKDLIEVPVAEVAAGDMVVIKPGEKVPVDGVVEDGVSEIDESLITGESVPVLKQVGDGVTGGAINGTGLLTVKATAVGEDSTLSKIIRLVENAQSGKAPVQRLVDKISAIFVPIVITIAVITFALWMIFTGNFEQALIASVSVLVIACPCALGLATPTAIVTGTGAAARAGILIKDIEALERAHNINAVIFDKTGTLTEGSPRVVDIHALSGDSAGVMCLAASVQQGSEHPLGKAIIRRAEELHQTLFPLKSFKSVTGRGVEAEIEEHHIVIGNRALMQQHKIETKAQEGQALLWESEAKTVVWLAVNGHLQGLIAIADPVRAQAKPAIKQLKSMGVRTLMLTGDAKAVAKAVAEEVGIDEAIGPVQPQDKAQRVSKLAAEGYTVGMIGDGINDAPALAMADVGIAMGSGTDVAMETAGITLMRSDPRLVAGAISASRATFSKIRQNLFWAFIYNVIGIPLAAMGMLSPAIAGAAMAMSSVSVVSNSLLLRRWAPKLKSD